MRNASMKVLKNLVCCAAFICLMFVLASPHTQLTRPMSCCSSSTQSVHRLVWLL